MLREIHFLLTYMCNFECDHCFLYCGPEAEGTFTLSRLRQVFDEISKIGTIDKVYFEGGESFLFYPLLLESLRIAHDRRLKTGIVTNAYWATSEEDAELWLRPIRESGIDDIFMSDDAFHQREEGDSPVRFAVAAAQKLGLAADTICIKEPSVEMPADDDRAKGTSVIDGGAMFRGRAAEKLTKDLPTREWQEFTRCPYEDLESPLRVHLDVYGHVHFCQGLSIGNMWETPLSELFQSYQADLHPICGPLVRGGPAMLAEEYHVQHENEYVDECHFCYDVRSALIDRFPQYLAPKQVYGLNQT